MKQKITPYIYIVFFTWNSINIHSQNSSEYLLKIASKDSIENTVISSINYKKSFSSKKLIQAEINKTIEFLKRDGFYSILIDNILNENNTHTVFLNLGIKIKKAIITIPSNFNSSNISKNKIIQFKIKANQLTQLLDSLNTEYTKKGKGFTKLSLTNTRIDKDIFYSELKIEEAKTRVINSIIVKGYEKFPKTYINHFYNIKKRNILNPENLKNISRQNSLLKFASEIKPPEILFSKDSTIIYVYLKKTKSNTFDGLINFYSEKGEKGINFNGYLDLSLINAFNYGEELNIHWKNNGKERQSFNLNAKTPYLFNTKISGQVDFNIYKSDSTFLNTKASLEFSTPINRNINIAINFESESSNDLLTNSQTDIKQFEKYFIGIGTVYNSLNKNKFNLETKISIGKRKTETNFTKQYKVDLSSSILFQLNNNLNLFIKNSSGLLFSNSYLQNEEYRLGGIHNFRGFKEESIFSSKYTFFNTEFRHKTVQNSYIYTIFDIGRFYKKSTHLNLHTFGIGYLYNLKDNKINISYTYGVNNTTNNNSFLNVKILTFF